MKVVIKNLQKRIRIDPAKIKKIANRINPPARFNHLKLAVYFVKNSIIKRLSRQYFEKDCLTDVISFNLGDDYAELFIAPCVVKDNARIFDVGFEEELYRCTIHGILHIFGFRDKTKKEKARMWRRQEAILREVFSDE
ncbi:rRNA maturation RNase YbeY [bacterium]|nr:rRNA maturation RNase YbeY [bacterium]